MPERGPVPGVGGSWCLLRALGAQAGRLARVRRPPGFQVQISAGFAASLPLLLFCSGEGCGSGAFEGARTALLRGRGADMSLVTRCFAPPASLSALVPFAPLAWKVHPVCRPGRASLCSAQESPFENTPEGGAVDQVKAFLSPVGQPPAHLVLIRAQGEIWPGP